MTDYSNRQQTLFWTLCCVLAGGVFLVYALMGLAAGQGELVMPLDDVYIHFQYARQIANGQPYVYNPGLAPTSGATSFLYPYVLAAGYILGFQDLNLGLWAMTIGALALAGSLWLIYRLGEAHAVPRWLTLLWVILFALSGPVAWHFMSGMETGLVIFLTLLTLERVTQGNFRGSLLAATLLALARPEGSIMAGIAVGVVLLQSLTKRNDDGLPVLRVPRNWLWISLPLLAILVQPTVNWLLTGSVSASGNQAKSVLGMVPFDCTVILARIGENFSRMWSEWAAATSLNEGVYLSHLIAPLAGIGLLLLFVQTKRHCMGLLILAWLLVGTAALATLDTAFWHFKRYQMPLLTLFFPLALWGAAWVWGKVAALIRHRSLRYAILVAFAGFLLISTFTTGRRFLDYFVINSHYVYLQPLQMARWLAANTPEDSVVAVHDVGMMRYLGQRTTLDMVGLTTPGMAEAWRNGPGTLAEALIQQRPDYIAAYTTAGGLSYLADTGLYGELLAGYEVAFDENTNVALGGHFQGIYRPDWAAAAYADRPQQPSVLNYLRDDSPLDEVNVANLDSEAQHDYQWFNRELLSGYAAEVYEQDYIDCAQTTCGVLDGGRRINGEESFDLALGENFAQSASDVILVTRLHPVNSGTVAVYVASDGQAETWIARRWIPAIPGQWLEIATRIPSEYVAETLHIRIVPDMPGGHYMPYYHWAYSSGQQTEVLTGDPVATMQDGAMRLLDYAQDYQPGADQLAVDLTWQTDGTAQGDYLVFVHLYADLYEPPVAQMDSRPGRGTLPPGNWLPGAIHDTIRIDLNGVQPGVYQLALGLYDPLTHERLIPVSDNDNVLPDGRLLLEEIEIQ